LVCGSNGQMGELRTKIDTCWWRVFSFSWRLMRGRESSANSDVQLPNIGEPEIYGFEAVIAPEGLRILESLPDLGPTRDQHLEPSFLDRVDASEAWREGGRIDVVETRPR